ncbi:MAG: MFS transporter [Muribaculaceae bacterium]|nr:MFS transporter [Muribaculaceae bacterium]
MKTKPDLSFWKLWNLSFGFFGVQIAYALQSANVSRIFTTIGADPHDLSYFWILPPLMGLLVQPIVGLASDRTWNRFGRRLPYLIVGALVAVAVMCLLPNAGSFHFTIGGAILFGLVALMMLDTSINMAMQPFKMLVGDMVNEKQKAKAYSIQSFLCNAGSVVGFVFPFCLGWLGLKKVAASGVVPDTVIWSFYIGAAILLICVIYSLVKIKEWPPQVYNEYNGISTEAGKPKQSSNVIKLLKNAPSTFWTVGLVQFFCWFAFLFMWTYTTNTVAHNAFDTPTTTTIAGVKSGDDIFNGKYIFLEQDGRKTLIVDHGALNKGVAENVFSTLSGAAQIVTADIATENVKGTWDLQGTSTYNVNNVENLKFENKTVLDAATTQYNEAGDYVGLLYAIQALGSVGWALLLPKLGSRKFSYIISLILGGGGFLMMAFVTNKALLVVAFLLIGCAWAAMLAWPFTILTNSLKSGNIGAYLGLFNCTICIPQIIAAIVGGWILQGFSRPGELAPEYLMMMLAGISLVAGSLCVLFIREGKEEPDDMKVTETPVISDNI